MTTTSTTFKKGEKRRKQGERGAGKATVAAREAIGAFVDGNAHRLTDWLDRVANGDGDNKANPAKAFEMFQSVVEYHIPKLARTEQKLNGEVTVKQYGWVND